jgi:hypothetical protein
LFAGAAHDKLAFAFEYFAFSEPTAPGAVGCGAGVTGGVTGGAAGTCGVTGCDTDDSAVVLTEFVASTVNLYAVPFARPETEHEVAAGVGAVDDVEQPIPGMTTGTAPSYVRTV